MLCPSPLTIWHLGSTAFSVAVSYLRHAFVGDLSPSIMFFPYQAEEYLIFPGLHSWQTCLNGYIFIVLLISIDAKIKFPFPLALPFSISQDGQWNRMQLVIESRTFKRLAIPLGEREREIQNHANVKTLLFYGTFHINPGWMPHLLFRFSLKVGLTPLVKFLKLFVLQFRSPLFFPFLFVGFSFNHL